MFVWLPTGYGKSLCYQVLPFITDYKHGVVETQRHSLVLVVSPLVALMVDQRSTIAFMCIKRHKIYPDHLYVSFLSLCNNFHVHAQTVCTRPSPLPILEGLGNEATTTHNAPLPGVSTSTHTASSENCRLPYTFTYLQAMVLRRDRVLSISVSMPLTFGSETQQYIKHGEG